MSNSEDRDLLRHLEMIARVKPSEESTRRAMDRVRRQVLTGFSPKVSTDPRIIRFIRTHPAIKVAVAACIVLAVTLTVIWHRPQPAKGPVASTSTSPRSTTPMAIPDIQPVAQQLRQVEALSADRDVDGLIDLLNQGRLEPRAVALAAQSLGRIGDSRAIGPLSRLAGQWTGDPDANPLEEAVTEIQRRVATTALATDVNGTSGPTAVQALLTTDSSKPVLSGLVTDALSGQPIAGADVQIMGPAFYQAQTDPDGSYHFDRIERAGDYHLQVQSARFLGLDPQDPCSLLVLGPDRAMVRDLKLKRGCQITVEVVDEDGRPIKDVRLAASWLGSEQSNDAGQPALTRQDGKAVVGALNPSEVAYQITAISTEYAPQHLIVTCSDPNVVDHAQMTLHPGVSIRGVAQYADGTPAQGIQIYAMPDWWHTNAMPEASPVDANGRFVLGSIQAGTYNLHASLPQGNGLAYSFAVTQTPLPLTNDQPLVVTIPRQAPQSLASLSGTIRWPGAARPDYVDITAYCPTGTITRGRLQPDVNSFALSALKPGTYTLIFEGANVEENVMEGVTVPGSDLEVSLQYVPTPRLRGIVLKAATNEPVEQFKVAMMKIRSWPGLIYLPETQGHPVSDPNGVFDLPTEGPGLYQVQVSADGFVPAVFDRVDTHQRRQLVVDLSTGGRIRGLVLTADGKPVSGATIVPLSNDRHARSLGSGLLVREQVRAQSRNGEFVLDHLAAGALSLRITHPQFSAATLEEIEVLEGKTTQGITVTLRRGGVVEGTVFDAQGQPQANVTLAFQDGDVPFGLGTEDGLLATAVTDDQGHYRVDRLPAGLCYLQRRNPDAHLGVVRRGVWPIEGRTVRLDLGGRPNVSGILALAGQPTAQCPILLADPANPHSGTFQCRAATETDGSFAFSGVPVGRYAVYYRGQSEWTRWIKVASVEVGTEDLDLGTLPRSLVRVAVTLTGSATPDWTVSLKEGRSFWSQKIGEVAIPETIDRPYLISQVLPGTYTLVAQSPDGYREITQAVEIGVDQTRLDVTVEIPSGMGTVSGAILNEIGGTLYLFNQERTLSVRLDGGSPYYRITGLPAGDYFVGNHYLLDKAPLARFHLFNGENKILDINTWQWSGANQGLLSIQVASSLGQPLEDADVWLEGQTGRIDPLIRTDREQVLIAPAGRYTLHVSQAGFQSQQQQVTIQSNKWLALVPARPVIPIILEPERTL